MCCNPNADYQASSGLLPSQDCPSWTVTNSADTEVPELVGGYLHVATSANTENLYYTQGVPNLSFPATLVTEARMTGSTYAEPNGS